MKTLSAVLITTFLTAPLLAQDTAAASATVKSFAKAREVLTAAADALGGLERVRGIKTMHRVGKGKTYSQGQGLGPDTPPIVRDIETDAWFDWAGNRARVENRLRLVGGIPIHTRTVLAGDTGYAWNAATNASTRFTPTGGAGLRNALRRDAVRVVATALSRAETARHLGTDTFDGRPHDVVSFADSDGTALTLYVDAKTRLPSKVETWSDTAVLGDTLNEQIFSDYRAVDGVKAPHKLTVRNAGQVTQELAYTTIELDASPDATAFELPANLLEPSPVATTPIMVTAVGPGLHLVTGGTHNSLAVEFKDHLVVVDAPLGSERSRAVIDKLAETVPGKPVRSVVNTHYHFDHSGGLREYVADGATVITHASNGDFVKKMAGGSRGIKPDKLSGKPAAAKVQTVTDKLVLSDGTQTLELYTLPNSHSNGMLVAYVPKEKVLFNADLFGPPLVGPVPSANDFVVELRDGIKKLGLQVETLAGAHGRVGKMADVEQSISMRQK